MYQGQTAYCLINLPSNKPNLLWVYYLETWVRSLDWKDPLEKRMATHSSILAWRSHGQRSLVGYSSQVCKELDMTERLTHTYYWFRGILLTSEICNFLGYSCVSSSLTNPVTYLQSFLIQYSRLCLIVVSLLYPLFYS